MSWPKVGQAWLFFPSPAVGTLAFLSPDWATFSPLKMSESGQMGAKHPSDSKHEFCFLILWQEPTGNAKNLSPSGPAKCVELDSKSLRFLEIKRNLTEREIPEYLRQF